MTIRLAALTAALLVIAACSKTEEAKQAPAPAAVAEPVPMAPAPEVSAPAKSSASVPAAAPQDRESQLEMRAAAAEARARTAEIELLERTRKELERQQWAVQAEAARAAVLAEEARRLDAENAALRMRALENEQRAMEAERAAYGGFGGPNVIIVQPPQRPRPRPSLPPQHEPPPKGAGISIGLNRPAVPDLTPPGAPATFGGPSLAAPKFDTMRARKPRDAQENSETPN